MSDDSKLQLYSKYVFNGLHGVSCGLLLPFARKVSISSVFKRFATSVSPDKTIIASVYDIILATCYHSNYR